MKQGTTYTMQSWSAGIHLCVNCKKSKIKTISYKNNLKIKNQGHIIELITFSIDLFLYMIYIEKVIVLYVREYLYTLYSIRKWEEIPSGPFIICSRADCFIEKQESIIYSPFILQWHPLPTVALRQELNHIPCTRVGSSG